MSNQSLRNIFGLIPCPAIALIARLVLGAIFLAAALPKLVHPVGFLQSVYDYHFIGGLVLSKLIALVVPVIELTVALLLLGGVLIRPAFWIATGLLLAFCSAQAWTIHQGITTACGCFGPSLSSSDMVGFGSLLRTAAIMAVAIIALIASNGDRAQRRGTPISNELRHRSDKTAGLFKRGLLRRGFTLLELLIVIGIITLLIAITFPVLRSVQRSANRTQCMSNMRQLAEALIMYANANKGAFPPNSGKDQVFWYQGSILGPYVGSKNRLSDGSIARGVFVCPNDLPDSVRSYSMNVFASSYFSPTIEKLMEKQPPSHGRPFRANAPGGSQLLLLLESWSELPQPIGSTKPEGYAAQAHIGFAGGTPGQRFGGGTGIVWTDPPDAAKDRFDVRATQIDFHRHAPKPARHIEDPHGAANFAFADGHVEWLRSSDLVDSKGRSTFRATWSPIDRQLERSP